MPVEFKLPDLGEGVAEGEILSWRVQEGESIVEDQPMVGAIEVVGAHDVADGIPRGGVQQQSAEHGLLGLDGSDARRGA